MSTRQLRKLVYFEQTLISVLAIICGLLLGTLFSKLFLMLMSSLLTVNSPIAFQLVPKAYLLTGIGFLLLFQGLTILSFWKMRSKQVIDLLAAAKKTVEHAEGFVLACCHRHHLFSHRLYACGNSQHYVSRFARATYSFLCCDRNILFLHARNRRLV